VTFLRGRGRRAGTVRSGVPALGI